MGTLTAIVNFNLSPALAGLEGRVDAICTTPSGRRGGHVLSYIYSQIRLGYRCDAIAELCVPKNFGQGSNGCIDYPPPKAIQGIVEC